MNCGIHNGISSFSHPTANIKDCRVHEYFKNLKESNDQTKHLSLIDKCLLNTIFSTKKTRYLAAIFDI